MEDILDLYAEPYDRRRPVVCFDELPVQLVSEVRAPLTAVPGRVAREDYEYKREGVANVFAFGEPLRGWRHLCVTAHRCKADFALQMRWLVDVGFPRALLIRLVLDNLSTHTPAALYETFPAAEARRILRRIEWHYTPTHGSWLNMAEIELSVLERQCLDRRIGDPETLRQETAAWAGERNQRAAKMEWQFTTADARIKLKHLYPSLKD
jgi:hypothetical protein